MCSRLRKVSRVTRFFEEITTRALGAGSRDVRLVIGRRALLRYEATCWVKEDQMTEDGIRSFVVYDARLLLRYRGG